MTQTLPERWPAPAKLNLFLHILARAPDGYHALQTLFQFLDRCDYLRITPRDDDRLVRTGGVSGIADDEDLVIRAARALRERSRRSFGVTIDIDKRIPSGGGLGGGSSDAATTLVALNRIFRLGLDQGALLELGRELGADVPVFVWGHAAFAEGRGERLSEANPAESWYLVVDPQVRVPTRDMYGEPALKRDCEPVTAPFDGCVNVFEPVVRSRFPEVAALLDWLAGHASARLTGSGGCVFAAFDTRSEAERVLELLPARWIGFVARGCNRSPLLDLVTA